MYDYNEGTKLEKELALSGRCNCAWCKEYRNSYNKNKKE